MGPKKGGENTKKLGGAAKKAEAAAAKQAAESQKKAAAEDADWQSGAKSNAKKEAAEAKKREAAAKKAEKERLAAEEAAALPDKPKAASKTAQKRTNKTGGIDGALSALNASGIDDALDALNISTTDGKAVSVDRHPERRFKAAYAAYEERRLPEVKEEHKGLRLNQMKDLIRKEFDRSPENPFNQTGVVAHNASKEEIEAARRAEKEKIEKRLEGK